jgi:hypothetical protein
VREAEGDVRVTAGAGLLLTHPLYILYGESHSQSHSESESF